MYTVINSWPQRIEFFEQSINDNYNTVTGYAPMEFDSGKQPRRFWDNHIKREITTNLHVTMQINRLQVNELITKVANKRTADFNATHKLQTLRVEELRISIAESQ